MIDQFWWAVESCEEWFDESKFYGITNLSLVQIYESDIIIDSQVGSDPGMGDTLLYASLPDHNPVSIEVHLDGNGYRIAKYICGHEVAIPAVWYPNPQSFYEVSILVGCINAILDSITSEINLLSYSAAVTVKHAGNRYELRDDRHKTVYLDRVFDSDSALYLRRIKRGLEKILAQIGELKETA